MKFFKLDINSILIFLYVFLIFFYDFRLESIDKFPLYIIIALALIISKINRKIFLNFDFNTYLIIIIFISTILLNAIIFGTTGTIHSGPLFNGLTIFLVTSLINKKELLIIKNSCFIILIVHLLIILFQFFIPYKFAFAINVFIDSLSSTNVLCENMNIESIEVGTCVGIDKFTPIGIFFSSNQAMVNSLWLISIIFGLSANNIKTFFNQKKNLILTILIFAISLIVKTKSIYLAVIMFVFVQNLFKDIKYQILFIFSLLFLFLIIPPDWFFDYFSFLKINAFHRLDIFNIAAFGLENLDSNPLGYGIDILKENSFGKIIDFTENAGLHNSLLNAIFKFGYVGIISYIIFAISFFRILHKYSLEIIWFTYFIFTQFHNDDLYNPGPALILVFLVLSKFKKFKTEEKQNV